MSSLRKQVHVWALAALVPACSGPMNAPADVDIKSTPLTSSGNQAGEEVRYFDGIDDRAIVRTSGAYDFGTGDFTVEVRARVLSASHLVPLVSKRPAADPYSGFYFLVYGDRLLLQISGMNALSQSVPQVRDGNYHHLAARRVGGSITLFLDGVAVGTGRSNDSASSNADLLIGYDPADNAAFQGHIREVHLHAVGVADGQLAQSSTGVAPSGPGLVGSWNMNRVAIQHAADASGRGNGAFLGTTSSDDAQDPRVQLFIETLRPTGGASNARIAGGTPTPGSCGDVLAGGTFDIVATASQSNYDVTVKEWFCSDRFYQHEKTRKGGAGVSVPIEGIPVKFGADWDNKDKITEREAFCSDSERTFNYFEAEAVLRQVASQTIVQAWLECMKLYVRPEVLHTTSSLSSDQKVLTLGTRAQVLVPGQDKAKVYAFTVIGAECPVPYQPNQIIDVAFENAVCTRTGAGPVTAVLSTNMGSVVWNFASTTQANVWASAGVPEWGAAAKRCNSYRTSKYNCPDIRFSWKCEKRNGRIWTDGWYPAADEKVSNASVTINEDDDYTEVQSASIDSSNKVTGTIKVWKQREVGWNVCADVQKRETKKHTTAPKAVDVSLPFQVVVPANATNVVLHVQQSDGTERVVDLETPGAVASVYKASNGVETFYEVVLRR
jgi:hypothetical protein